MKRLIGLIFIFANIFRIAPAQASTSKYELIMLSTKDVSYQAPKADERKREGTGWIGTHSPDFHWFVDNKKRRVKTTT